MSQGGDFWVRVAGMSGGIAVLLGAAGAHAFVKRSEAMRAIWQTGTLYHLVHTAALAVAATGLYGKKRSVVCGLFTAGMLLFCGAMYTIVMMDEKQPYNKIAPVGGILLTAGWFAMALM